MAFNQYKQYLLVTRWVFDFSHHEYCSLTLEGGGADNIMKLFGTDDQEAIGVWNLLIKKICDAQNRNPMDVNNCKPVALYRVTGPNKPYDGVGLPEGKTHHQAVGIGLKFLSFELELIGLFDRDGKPIPTPETVPV